MFGKNKFKKICVLKPLILQWEGAMFMVKLMNDFKLLFSGSDVLIDSSLLDSFDSNIFCCCIIV